MLRFKISEFSKNVATLLSGTVIAQALALLFSPIISRLYTPDDFAVLALYIGILKVAQIAATGRYEFAIVLPSKDTDAVNVLSLSVLITTIISILSLIILYPLNKQLGVWLNNQRIEKWIYLLPFSLFLAGFYKAMNFWLIRQKSYKKISVSKISASAGGIAVKIAGAKLLVRETGLVLGRFITDFIQAIIFLPDFVKAIKQNKTNTSKQNIKFFARKYKDFPLFNTLLVLSDQLKDSGVIFVISSFFGSLSLGLYSFGMRYSRGPTSIISQSFTQVFYKKISDLKNSNQPIIPFAKKLLKKLLIIAFAVFIVLFFGGEIIFSFVFGEQWRLAGHYVSILAIYIAVNLVSAPFSDIALVLDKQRQFLIIGSILNFFLLTVLILSSLIIKNFETVLIITSFTLTLNNLIILFWYFKIAKQYDKKI